MSLPGLAWESPLLNKDKLDSKQVQRPMFFTHPVAEIGLAISPVAAR